MRRTRCVATTIFLSFAVCLAAWPAGAQDTSGGAGQSALARARSVIAEELAKGGASVDSDRVERNTLISFRGCEMRYRKDAVATGVAMDATAALTDLDPERVRVGNDGRTVTFATRGGARKIRLPPLSGVSEAGANAGEEASGRRRAEINFPRATWADFFRVRSRGSAARLRDAMEQAIRACEGRP